ncbi:hypothetical protein A1O1_04453 [Capronia coronata CBS 617.96]|uniref:Uncharacterized protein n=1 Tax=Capronia coronata CBS 617.96 TaxID=1182541 RepID=W9YQ46_9EURO|nr:uncharacterized protein A1O1_04453 [Capronia coronata CBS 617.96]EXJ91341.1 hypothetical protein A1O1_04453 [Capronia coronata CBS 617.96]
MIPKAALVILIAVVSVASITFMIAIYHGITSHLRSRRRRREMVGQSNESTLPLTAAAAAAETEKGTVSASNIPTASMDIPERSPTPEAEFPPPLPGEALLETHPALSHEPDQPKQEEEEDVAEAEYPPPLPEDLKGIVVIGALEKPQIHPLPSRPCPPRAAREREKERGRERNSMHEIIDLYTSEGRNRNQHLPPGPKSAPARITTFAQAGSKWAYFGAKRAEFHIV